jgi:hypothetical protein
MTFLRFIRIFALALWLGSFFFFAVVVAPTLFTVLPTRALAGQIVSRSLFGLHWVGIGSAVVYVLASILLGAFPSGTSLLHRRDLLLAAMLAITFYLHFSFEPRMVRLRDSMGVIDNVARNDPRRVEFDRMHVWSTRGESTVFFLGIVLLYLVVREDEIRLRGY